MDFLKGIWDTAVSYGTEILKDVDWKDAAEKAGKYLYEDYKQQEKDSGTRPRVNLAGRYSLDVRSPSGSRGTQAIQSGAANAAAVHASRWSAILQRARREAQGTSVNPYRTITSRTYMKRPKELG